MLITCIKHRFNMYYTNYPPNPDNNQPPAVPCDGIESDGEGTDGKILTPSGNAQQSTALCSTYAPLIPLQMGTLHLTMVMKILRSSGKL